MMGDEREKLLAEAAEHRFTVGPDMGVCAADGVSDIPLGEVLRAEADLVQRLAAALRAVPPVETVTAEQFKTLPEGTWLWGRWDHDKQLRPYEIVKYRLLRALGAVHGKSDAQFEYPMTVLWRPDTEGSG